MRGSLGPIETFEAFDFTRGLAHGCQAGRTAKAAEASAKKAERERRMATRRADAKVPPTSDRPHHI